jgi:hypothetical protein
MSFLIFSNMLWKLFQIPKGPPVSYSIELQDCHAHKTDVGDAHKTGHLSLARRSRCGLQPLAPWNGRGTLGGGCGASGTQQS